MNGGNKGIRFTEIDMTLNGGLGGVVAGNKNVFLMGTNTTEGAGIAKHANGCDYWIIGKEVGTTNVKTFLVSNAGVNTTPIVSTSLNVGAALFGSIKASPNSKLISIVNNPSIEVFDFDNATGILTTKFSDNIGTYAYSTEFSPDNNVVYSTTLSNPNIYQYNLSLPNASIVASKQIIGTTANSIGYRMCGLQLAPNGKIYTALQRAYRLGAIENPNVLGVGCNYNDNAIAITGNNTNGSSMNVVLGLPAFPSFFIFPNEIQFESANYDVNQYFCNSDSITFKISGTNSVQSVDWYVSPVNTSYNSNPDATANNYSILPSTNGDYKIMAIVNYTCFIDTIIDTITVNAIPNINLGADIDSCTNNPVVLDATTSGISSYSWSNNINTPTNSISSSNQYILDVTDGLGCSNSDTINIIINEVPNANFSAFSVCLNQQSLFTNQSSISSGSIANNNWDFNDGNNSMSTSPTHTYQNDGNYSVELVVTSNNGCRDTSIQNYIVYPIPNANAGLDTTLNCMIDALILDGSQSSSGNNFSYSWTTNGGNILTNTTNDSITINQDGWYYLNITDNSNSCVTSDSVFVAIDTLSPSFNIGINTLLTCINPSITLGAINNQNGNFSYSWSSINGNIVNGQSTLSPEINQVGIYSLTIINSTNHCSKTDSLTVSIDTIHPITQVNPDTLINCLNPQIQLSGVGSSTGNFSYLWTTNEGNIVAGTTTLTPEISAPGIYALTVTNNYNGCTTSNQVSVSQNDSAFVAILFNESALNEQDIYSFASNTISYEGNQGAINWTIDNSNFSNDSSFNYTFETSGNHIITIDLTNQDNGCIAYDTIYLTVTHQLEIPNLISPNADGFNDVFIIRALENYDDNSLTIFNRWGNSVFEAAPYQNDWNGQTNVNGIITGSKVVDGTYFYTLTLTEKNKKTIQRGFIEVKRK